MKAQDTRKTKAQDLDFDHKNPRLHELDIPARPSAVASFP